jgi:hypothetical protein
MPGASREDATNSATIFFSAHNIRTSHAALFARHLSELRDILAQYPRRGVVVVAIATGTGVAGHLWLEANDKLRVGVVGRHGRADLFVPGDGDLSLRHLAILVRGGGEQFRIRVIDLRTPGGFDDENGERLAAVSAEGPLFFGAARYQFFVFPTGAALPWQDGAEEPWKTLPPRVYQDRRAGSPPVPKPDLPRRPKGGITVVNVNSGPVAAAGLALLTEAEPAAGHLVVGSGQFEERIAVGNSALDRGVLLGRYRRCDSAGMAAFSDDRISRVHALVVRDGRELFVLDLCSTNGVWMDGEEIRMRKLAPGDVFRLGSRTAVRWEPAVDAAAA